MFNLTQPNFWNSELESEFAIIAKKYFPNEVACAIIDNSLVELDNIADDKENNFKSELPYDRIDRVQGIIHSHPNYTIMPSFADYSTQIALGIPSGIVSLTEDSISESFWIGDHTLDIPLVGRPFLHGYLDCYSLIRSYYKQTYNIIINDYAREDNWWNEGKNLYDDFFTDAGFYQVSDLMEGDVIMMQINSPVVNHAGVYIGDGKILHHLYHRLSREDNIGAWGKMVTKIVRYKW